MEGKNIYKNGDRTLERLANSFRSKALALLWIFSFENEIKSEELKNWSSLQVSRIFVTN